MTLFLKGRNFGTSSEAYVYSVDGRGGGGGYFRLICSYQTHTEMKCDFPIYDNVVAGSLVLLVGGQSSNNITFEDKSPEVWSTGTVSGGIIPPELDTGETHVLCGNDTLCGRCMGSADRQCFFSPRFNTQGGEVLELSGKYFGCTGATDVTEIVTRVLVGGVLCPILYAHCPDKANQTLGCLLPEGQGVDIPVVVQVCDNNRLSVALCQSSLLHFLFASFVFCGMVVSPERNDHRPEKPCRTSPL